MLQRLFLALFLRSQNVLIIFLRLGGEGREQRSSSSLDCKLLRPGKGVNFSSHPWLRDVMKAVFYP